MFIVFVSLVIHSNHNIMKKLFFELGTLSAGIKAVHKSLQSGEHWTTSPLSEALYSFTDFTNDEYETFDANTSEFCLEISEELNNAAHSMNDGDTVHTMRLLERIDLNIFDFVSSH